MIDKNFIIADKTRKISKENRLVYDALNKKVYSFNNQIIENYINNRNDENTKKIFDVIQKKSLEIIELRKKIIFHEDKLNLIRILVTNNCNLKCKYCYALDGNYGQKITYMSKYIADKVCKYIHDNYKFVREINFFGGEPMLNIEVIEYICNKIVHQYHISSRKIPTFSVVTNGTVMSEKILEVIKKYKINVTVSLDYPDELVNDDNRIYSNGTGTFKIIDKNINKLIKETDSLFAIEATYNQKHIENKISYIDIIKKNYFNYGVKLSIVSPVSNNNLFLEKNKNFFEEQLQLFSSIGIASQNLMTFLKSLFSHSFSEYYCDALIGQIAISPNGDIYPCQMFIAQNIDSSLKKFCIGNVQNLENNRKSEILKWLKKYNTKNLNSCKNCNIKSSCSDCVFYKYLNKNYSHSCNKKIETYYEKVNTFLNFISNEENEIRLRENIVSLLKR